MQQEVKRRACGRDCDNSTEWKIAMLIKALCCTVGNWHRTIHGLVYRARLLSHFTVTGGNASGYGKMQRGGPQYIIQGQISVCTYVHGTTCIGKHLVPPVLMVPVDIWLVSFSHHWSYSLSRSHLFVVSFTVASHTSSSVNLADKMAEKSGKTGAFQLAKACRLNSSPH